jgi:Arc/MetJ family transcription regulator
LTGMSYTGIIPHMRTTLNIDDALLKKASMLTGVDEKTSLVNLSLKALIARESGKRLAKLGGTDKDLKPIARRRVNLTIQKSCLLFSPEGEKPDEGV